MVGFDRKRGLPRRGGGVFGIVKAFVGAIESQKNGTLHWHSIFFIAGLPVTSEEFVKMCGDPVDEASFRRRFCALIDSVLRTSIPLSNVGIKPSCPKCGEVRELLSLEKVSKRAFGKQARYLKPVAISRCGSCEATFGVSEIVREQLKKLHETLEQTEFGDMLIPIGDTHRHTDDLTEAQFALPWKPKWPSTEESALDVCWRLHNLRLARIALLTQDHNHRHVPSCFKSSLAAKTGECRYSFPRKAIERTHVDEKNCLHVERAEHNEYINPYNDVMALALCTNHDIRPLVGSGTTDALYYCMKYVTKVHIEVNDLERVLMGCYDRRMSAEQDAAVNGTQITKSSMGRARVNSMAITLSKKQEVSAPMCALYLRRKTSLISSHRFAPLLLAQIMAIIRQEEHETTLVEETSGEFVKYRNIPITIIVQLVLLTFVLSSSSNGTFE